MPKSDQQLNYHRYVVIPRVLIFLFDKKDVLLIKNSNEKRLWGGKYNGIGGHIELGEDIINAAKRELKEETGINNCPIWLCGLVMTDVYQSKGVCLFIFKGFWNKEIKLPGSDEGELRWVNIASIKKILTVEDLPKLLKKVNQQNREDQPFFARSYYSTSAKNIIIFNS